MINEINSFESALPKVTRVILWTPDTGQETLISRTISFEFHKNNVLKIVFAPIPTPIRNRKEKPSVRFG